MNAVLTGLCVCLVVVVSRYQQRDCARKGQAVATTTNRLSAHFKCQESRSLGVGDERLSLCVRVSQRSFVCGQLVSRPRTCAGHDFTERRGVKNSPQKLPVSLRERDGFPLESAITVIFSSFSRTAFLSRSLL